MPADKKRSTPGVSITELSAAPNSIPGVQTAIPAFIGYSEKAIVGGKPVYFTPVFITSLADYEAIFGGEFEPNYTIQDNGSATSYDFVGQCWNAKDKEFESKYFHLSRVANGTAARVSAAASKAALPPFDLYNSVRLFYANGGGICYIVSVGDYTNNGATPTGVAVNYKNLSDGLAAIALQTGPTMLVIPDAVLLAPEDATAFPPVSDNFNTLCREMLTQCGTLQDRVAILDVYGTDAIDPDDAGKGPISAQITKVTDAFHESVGDGNLQFGAAYFPFLVTSIIQPDEVDYTNFDLTVPADPDQVSLQDFLLAQAAYLYPSTDPAKIGPDADDNPTFLTVKDWIAAIPHTVDKSTPAGQAAIATLNENLAAAVPVLQQMEKLIAYNNSLLPPSGAMTGVYSLNDATRGVWNAPANIVVNSVVESSVKVNGDQQGSINVPLDGKAINVIRDFVGRGPVVWGARTLDGNSNDWRYIHVRRTIIYIEQSIKTALNQFVFASNDATTWVVVTEMISGFLQNLWSQGGLMGDKASDAFTVQCGLGSTMTGMDILQGYMVVAVTLQMIHPAEFIELTFKQKMEGVS